METGWERTLPFLKVNRKIVEELFKGVLEKNQIKEISIIDEGCRTTNYIVESIFNKKYILKIFYEKSDSYKKEIKLFKELSGKIPVSYIYKFSRAEFLEKREYIIYNYLEGQSLSSYIQRGNKIDSELAKQAACILSSIHKNRYNKIGFLNENLIIKQELPPITEWYKMFMGKNAVRKLGENLKEKILHIVNQKKGRLIELKNSASLIHGDFQGTNILVKDNNISGILDWEFSMAGYPIADIGQFFRYDNCFDNDLLQIFKCEYNKHSHYKLEEDWYKLAKLIDLVNLIQLLDKDAHMPNKDKDIIGIIRKSLNQLENM